MYRSDVLKDLDWRGMIFQKTHDELDDALAEAGLTLYLGVDPTADSMHIGHLVGAMAVANFRRHGHNPIALVGGATGLIGDPSGKSEERNLLDAQTIDDNVEALGSQLRAILNRAMTLHPETLPSAAERADDEIPIMNNADWMKDWSFIEFLRDVGKNFRVNVMMQKESVKSRLERDESGLSYTEFSYMLIQAYDFLHLYKNHACTLQIGGSDQWGNITAGTDLIRRSGGESAFGLTFPLLTSSSGKKFGKTEAGAVWLDPERTSPYEFYQYWVSSDDADCEKLLKTFTFLPRAEVEELAATIERGENRGGVQRKLAWEVTALVHGSDEADKAVRASKVLFGEKIEGFTDKELGQIFADVPSSELSKASLQDGIGILDFFNDVDLCKSNGAARRLIKQGGGYVNNNRIEDIGYTLTLDDLASETKLVLRAGKKKYHVVSVRDCKAG